MKKECVPEVVAGSTRRALRVTLVDEDDLPINLTGQDVKLQAGAPEDLAPEIDLDGVVEDAVAGVVRFDSIGSAVSVAQMNAARARRLEYGLRVKLFDVAIPAIVDWTDEFELAFVLPPLETS